jgi:hypothetical protein
MNDEETIEKEEKIKFSLRRKKFYFSLKSPQFCFNFI